MALNAYLKLKGQKQGDIKGSVAERNREGSIMVIAVGHEIASPRDAATGQASGKRMHKPIVITKELDRSSPQLYTALTTNESIPEWTLEFSRADPRGAERAIFTIRLTNAAISDIQFVMPNNKQPELMKLNEYEQVAFAYEKIEWTWLDPKIAAADSWQQRG